MFKSMKQLKLEQKDYGAILRVGLMEKFLVKEIMFILNQDGI